MAYAAAFEKSIDNPKGEKFAEAEHRIEGAGGQLAGNIYTPQESENAEITTRVLRPAYSRRIDSKRSNPSEPLSAAPPNFSIAGELYTINYLIVN